MHVSARFAYNMFPDGVRHNVFHKRVGHTSEPDNANLTQITVSYPQQPLRWISPEFVNKVFITLVTLTSSMNC